MIIFGIDPGTGLNSACGIAVLVQEKPGDEIKLTHMEDIWPTRPHKNAMSRIKDIVDQVEDRMADAYEMYPYQSLVIGIESFVMRGKGGETLQRFIGAVLSRVPRIGIPIIEIQNTTMKKFVGGSGKSDKEAVLKKVLIAFPANKMLLEAAVRKEYDSIDAIGIAMTTLDRARQSDV